jgi:MOSC domain-containing protein YiiM
MTSIRAIFLSPGHNFFGRHGQPAGGHPMREVEAVECVAGCGLRGDRFFAYRPDYKGQVTLFSSEVLGALREKFSQPQLSLAALRRNVLVEGVDLAACIGTTFALQGVELEGVEECRPCHWMEQAVGPGAEDWLRGRGGLRCRINRTGFLRCERERTGG